MDLAALRTYIIAAANLLKLAKAGAAAATVKNTITTIKAKLD